MIARDPFRFPILVLAIVFSLVWTARAEAQPFIVQGVEIDATASTAFDAQRAAMSEGQLRAAQILIERMSLPEDRLNANMAPLTSDVAAGLIARLQISDEQRSSTRYRAVLSVMFDRREVRNFFNARGIAYVESATSPTLVVPVLEGESGDVIWGSDWLRAWQRGGFENALAPHIAVGTRLDAGGEGTLRDLITPAQARNLDRDALERLAQSYGVDTVAVIMARAGGGSVRAVGVELKFGQDGVTQTNIPSVATGSFAATARAIVQRREEDWKRASVVRSGEAAEMQVTVLFDSLPQWRSLQQALAGASLVDTARLDALSRTGASMTISHRGTREQLMSELAARGASFSEDEALGWTVRSR